jgi:medium-chain acyl-[acyl-carrier-protein] hydrolase
VTADRASASRWFVPLRLSARSSRRVYCFPYAGGGGAAFYGLTAHLPADIGIHVASLPARGARLHEPAITSIPQFACALADALEREEPDAFVLLGHSMGALIAYETAHELRRRRAPRPAALVLTGARAPHLFAHARRAPISTMSDTELVDFLRELGGTPPEVLASAELMELLLPAIRGDFGACDSYRYADRAPLDSPLRVLCGADDADVAASAVAGWAQHTVAGCEVERLDGGHFFINQHWPSIARQVQRCLAGASAQNR